MAESKPNREEDLTCPICVETFRTPLTLPCQHSFCKDCISLYIDKAKSGQAEESSSSRGGARGVVHQVISCPVCREPARLGSDGVNSLPVNCRLSEAVEEFLSEVEVKDNTLWCSVCDENNEAEAVKFCTTCRLFYCEDCLAWFHPMRGGFKCHSLISPQEYLTRTAPEAQGKADEGSKLKSSCSSHHQPLSIYCEPCQAVICVECVVEHAGHAVRDIQSAADRDKPKVVGKASEVEKVLEQTKKSLAGFKRLHSQIQDNQNLHNQDVQKAYGEALEALNLWKMKSVEAITKRYSRWKDEFNASVKLLQIQAEELEGMLETSKDLLSSVDVDFLQNSKQFMKRVDNQLTEKKRLWRKQEDCRQRLQKGVKSDEIVPRQVTLRETTTENQGEARVKGGDFYDIFKYMAKQKDRAGYSPH